MRALVTALTLAAGLAFAACGDTDTTVINQTTTVAPTSTAATTTTAPATTTQVSPAEPAPAPVEEPKEEADPGDEDYSGPCGEAGVVTGGTPGTSANTSVPGYANVETVNANCPTASTVAVQWVEQWDTSCLAGCSRRIEGLLCKYAGSGSSVQCRSSKSTVAFELGFQITG